jgi:hypothetical protein
MIEGYLNFVRASGVDRGGSRIVSLLVDTELARSFGNVWEFANAGNSGLTPESQRRLRELEGNAREGDGDPIFIEHDDRQAARSLRPMREGH